MYELFILFVVCIQYALPLVEAREAILSCGLNGWNSDRLQNQYTAFGAYASMNIITASSILVYTIDEDGWLGTYTTNTSSPYIDAEDYQRSLQKFGLKTFPCIYCDATIGNCANLGDRLDKLFEHQQDFINSTIDRARKYGWNGYTVDFEPDQYVDADRVTDFILDWGKQLRAADLMLYVWIGGPTPYSMTRLQNTDIEIKLITMNTYASSYDQFIYSAADCITRSNSISNIGFGLLTIYEGQDTMNEHMYGSFKQAALEFDEVSMALVSGWAKTTKTHALSIWATNIPPTWWKSMYTYVNT